MKIHSECLTLDDPRWREFANRLDDAVGDPDTQWDCDHTLRHSAKILEGMGVGIDVFGTLEWLADHGGRCDCEVLMNVDRLPGDQEQVLECLMQLLNENDEVTARDIAQATGLPVDRVEVALAGLEGGGLA